MKRLTKSFSSLLTLVMCMTLCFTTVHAEVTESKEKLHVNYDVSTVMHLNVGDLADVAVTATSSNGKSDTVYLTADTYNNDFRQYQLQFDIGGFKVDDKISFSFSDATVTQDVTEATITSEEIYSGVDIGSNPEDFVPEQVLTGTAEYPLRFSLSKDYKNQAFITIVDESRAPVGNREVVVCSYSGMSTHRYTTDANGKFTINLNDFDGASRLFFENREFKFKNGDAVVDDFELYQLMPGKQYTAVITNNPDYIAPAITDDNVPFNIEVKTARDGLYNINNTLTLVFTDAFDSREIDNIHLGDNILLLPDTEYTITVPNNSYGYTATPVKATSEAVATVLIDTSSSLKVVDSKNGATSFEVLNIDALAGQTFAVGKEYAALNGESFIIKDNNGAVYTVNIDNSELTTIDLADGSVSATGTNTDKTSPQTSDSVGLWVALIIFALLALAVLVFLYYKNGKNTKKGTQILSLLLVGALISGIVVEPVTSYAWSVEGAAQQSTGNSGGGTGTPVGAFQTAENGYESQMSDQAFLKVSLVINPTPGGKDDNGNLVTDHVGIDATVSQLEQDSKFWFKTNADKTNTAIYLFNDPESYERTLRGGIIGMNYETRVLGTLYGKNHLTKEVINEDEYWARLFDFSWKHSDDSKYNYDDEDRMNFIEFFKSMLYHDVNKSSAVKLYESYGDHIREYVRGKFNSPDSKDETKDVYENSVINGYIDYLEAAQLISNTYANDLRKAYRESRLVILAESMMGMYIKGESAETGDLYGISAHDTMLAFNMIGGGKLPYPSRELSALRGNEGEGKVYWKPASEGGSPFKSRIATCTGGNCTNQNCKALRHIPWSGVRNMLNVHLNVLRPSANTINQDANPFGGWGYIALGKDMSYETKTPNVPGIWATYEYTIIDADSYDATTGSYSGVTTGEQEVAGWGKEDLPYNTIDNIAYGIRSGVINPALAYMEVEENGVQYMLVLGEPEGVLKAEFYVTENVDDNQAHVSKIDNIFLSQKQFMLQDSRFNSDDVSMITELRNLTKAMSKILDSLKTKGESSQMNLSKYFKEAITSIVNNGSTVTSEDHRRMTKMSIGRVLEKMNKGLGDVAQRIIDAVTPDDVELAVNELNSNDKLDISAMSYDDVELAYLGLAQRCISLEEELYKKFKSDILLMGSGNTDPGRANEILRKNYFGGSWIHAGKANTDEAKNIDLATLTDDGIWEYDVYSSQPDKLKQLAVALNSANEESDYNGSGINGNIKIKFTGNLVYYRIPITTNLKAKGDVPEWRINKYWDSVLPLLDTSVKVALDSNGYLTYSEDDSDSHKTSTLAINRSVGTSISVGIKLNSNDISSTPFYAKPLANKSKVTFTHSDPTAPVKIWSDFVANKKSSVDNLAPAKWVNSSPIKYTDANGSEIFRLDASTGEDRTAGDTQVSKDVELVFSYSPTKAITHYIAKRNHSYWHGCKCYLASESAEYHKSDVTYGVDILFDCFNQTTKTPRTISDTRNSTDGFTELTVQSPKNIRLYSEVPMLFTTPTHNNSIRFMAADKATEIKPISYHTIAYDTLIKPSLSGVAATDYRAVQTLADLGTPEAQMLLKGSATTTAYDMMGTLTATSYALDVDNNYYKTAWANNDYTAEKTNSEFLKGFANPQADGSYTATIDATENLKIGGQSYGAMKNELTVKSTGTTTDRYELTIRAGEITAINGYLDWATRYPEIADVLINKMKATHSGVFSVFASGEGGVLDEPEFERLAKSLREGSESIKEGTGWYSEDCTTLSLYVYTTKFDLVGTQFSNKVPTSLPDLETPQNKDFFYTNAKDGDLTLDLALQVVEPKYETPLHYETSLDKWSDRIYDLYAVGNVSVLDSTN